VSDRLSTRTRVALLVAQHEARRLGHQGVAPEHLLAALIAEGRGIAFRTLSELGVSSEATRAEARAAYGTGSPSRSAPRSGGLAGIARRGPALPYLPATKQLLEQASREAEALSDPVVATEHVLLAFTADPAAGPAALLVQLHGDPELVRRRVLELRAARSGPGEPAESGALAGERHAGTPAHPDPAAHPGPPGRAAVDDRSATAGHAGVSAAAAADGQPARQRPRPRGSETPERRRWTLDSGRRLAAPVDGAAAGPRCTGCGGLLEGHLVASELPVLERGGAPSSAAGGGGDTGAGLLRVVSCSSCGHVVHTDEAVRRAPPVEPPGGG
jgi:ATP-dependent Clp protease ATP-binding subunit ClpC